MYAKYADDEGVGSEVIVWPVPYEGAVSYGSGAKEGPRAIMRASLEIETWDEDYKIDIRDVARFKTLDYFEPPVSGPKYVFRKMYEFLKQHIDPKKDFLMTLGGDHSIALAPILFYKEAYKDLFLIQIDAHADLRDEFQGSNYSHGCVMARVRENKVPIIQLGIRSLCKEESIKLEQDREITTFFAKDLKEKTPQEVVEKLRTIIGSSPIYITFDVDGLDPSIVPGTGTPEPGGIEFWWIWKFWRVFFEQMKNRLVGIDVCELAPIPNQVVSESTVVKLINRIICSYFRQTQSFIK